MVYSLSIYDFMKAIIVAFPLRFGSIELKQLNNCNLAHLLFSLGKNCAELYKSGQRISGVYTIDPDGSGAFGVFCDQTTAGGGWTVLQKRLDGSVDFYRGWHLKEGRIYLFLACNCCRYSLLHLDQNSCARCSVRLHLFLQYKSSLLNSPGGGSTSLVFPVSSLAIMVVPRGGRLESPLSEVCC